MINRVYDLMSYAFDYKGVDIYEIFYFYFDEKKSYLRLGYKNKSGIKEFVKLDENNITCEDSYNDEKWICRKCEYKLECIRGDF